MATNKNGSDNCKSDSDLSDTDFVSSSEDDEIIWSDKTKRKRKKMIKQVL